MGSTEGTLKGLCKVWDGITVDGAHGKAVVVYPLSRVFLIKDRIPGVSITGQTSRSYLSTRSSGQQSLPSAHFLTDSWAIASGLAGPASGCSSSLPKVAPLG